MKNKNIRQKLANGFTFVQHEATIFTVYTCYGYEGRRRRERQTLLVPVAGCFTT